MIGFSRLPINLPPDWSVGQNCLTSLSTFILKSLHFVNFESSTVRRKSQWYYLFIYVLIYFYKRPHILSDLRLLNIALHVTVEKKTPSVKASLEQKCKDRTMGKCERV